MFSCRCVILYILLNPNQFFWRTKKTLKTEEYVDYHHQRDMTPEENRLLEFITLPSKHFLSNGKNSINYDEEYGLVDYHTRLSYKHYFNINEKITICYDAPELVSISKEEFNCIVNVIFNNARVKRMEKYSTLVREISQLNDNCIEYVMQYVMQYVF